MDLPVPLLCSLYLGLVDAVGNGQVDEARSSLWLAWTAALLACGCVLWPGGGVPEGDALRLADHPLVGRVWNVEAGRLETPEALLADLARHRYVLLGELHDNPDHHRRQARVVRALAAAGRRPAVVVEMIPADDAEALADVLARPGVDAEEVRRAVDWDASGWPAWALYAPIFEAALDAKLPLVAGDLGGEALGGLRAQGLAGLAPAARAGLGLDAAVPDALRRALGAEIREGHCDLLPEAAIPRMVDVQLARDAHLARALTEAAGPDGAVLVAGAGHVRSDAVPRWLEGREPGARVASVALLEVRQGVTEPALDLRERFGDAVPYDWIWYTPRQPREDPCARMRRALEAHSGSAGP